MGRGNSNQIDFVGQRNINYDFYCIVQIRECDRWADYFIKRVLDAIEFDTSPGNKTRTDRTRVHTIHTGMEKICIFCFFFSFLLNTVYGLRDRFDSKRPHFKPSRSCMHTTQYVNTQTHIIPVPVVISFIASPAAPRGTPDDE